MFSPGGNVPLLPGVQLQVVQLEGLELCVDSPLAVLGGSVAPVQHATLAPDQLEPVVPHTYLIITMLWCHDVMISRCHYVMIPRCHDDIMSFWHDVKLP